MWWLCFLPFVKHINRKEFWIEKIRQDNDRHTERKRDIADKEEYGEYMIQ